MKILVFIKQVPDSSKVQLDPIHHTLRRDRCNPIINPYDLNALEYALSIKDCDPSVQVGVLCMGPITAEREMRLCLAMGADECILLNDSKFAGSDTLASSFILASAVRSLGSIPEVLVFGKQSIDGDTGQVGPEVAEWLDLPVVTCCDKVSTDQQAKALYVERKNEGITEKFKLVLPCVISVTSKLNIPRFPTLQERMLSFHKKIRILGNKELKIGEEMIGLEGSPTWVRKVEPVNFQKKCAFITSQDLKNILKTEGLLK